MDAKSTRYPGVYRRGRRWRYTWRDVDGKQRWGTADTEDEAWRERSRRIASREYVSAVTVQAFARDWLDRYLGRTVDGISEATREQYRRELGRHVLPFLGPRLRLVDMKARHIGRLYAHLVSDDGPGLADTTVRKVVAPLKAMLNTAVEEGVLTVSPATAVRLPVRPRIEEDDAQVKALTTDELRALLDAAAPEWRCLLVVLVLTGLRVSEALALRWQDVDLDAVQPVVRVRRRWRDGAYAPPKSRYGRRDVPLAADAVAELLDRRSEVPDGDDDLVFARLDGRPWAYGTILEPAIKQPARAAGVPWAAFHTLRHTCATRLVAAGRTGPQVQQWLGHHDPAFTLRLYVGLQDNDLGAPLDLAQNDDDPATEGGVV